MSSTLQLTFLWLAIGGILGLLGNAAYGRAYLANWRARTGLIIAGAISSTLGAWLGIWLVGTFAATAMAVWIAAVMVLLLPLLLKQRTARPSQQEREISSAKDRP